MARAIMRSDRVSVQDLVSVLCAARQAVAVRERAAVRTALNHPVGIGPQTGQRNVSM